MAFILYFRATENSDEKGGSFDASGAFHGPGWSDEDDSRQKSSSPSKFTRSASCTAMEKQDSSVREEWSEAEGESKQDSMEDDVQNQQPPPNLPVDSSQESQGNRNTEPAEVCMHAVHFFI